MNQKICCICLLFLLAFTSALIPRQKAPDWRAVGVIDGESKEISLEDYSGKYLVMLFYPFDFTYVCPTELIAFSEEYQKFKDLSAEVVAISVDSHFTHLAWMKTPRNQGGVGNLRYPLLSDLTKEIGESYNVLVQDKEDELFGAHLRGLFIIDGDKTIRSIQINDAPVGRSVHETLRLIEAFQYTDQHGEVCPANWKKGDKTIVPDQEKKSSYFSEVYREEL
ncbi:unnamed protein product [Moneuplotes crassus]|uniref:thioredoxin-dependent peroxiredoxin n=1 Tax=Euplotes crassus TaxID=5936 RepID=A0AAD2D524_EUPCR|nr:unnamed protein product [Moneuplotes crassus]